jgi:hypothetical protein
MEKRREKEKGIKEKGQSQTGPSAQCTGPAQLARSLFSLPLRVTFLLAERPRAGERPTRRLSTDETGPREDKGCSRSTPLASPVTLPLSPSSAPPLLSLSDSIPSGSAAARHHSRGHRPRLASPPCRGAPPRSTTPSRAAGRSRGGLLRPHAHRLQPQIAGVLLQLRRPSLLLQGCRGSVLTAR